MLSGTIWSSYGKQKINKLIVQYITGHAEKRIQINNGATRNIRRVNAAIRREKGGASQAGDHELLWLRDAFSLRCLRTSLSTNSLTVNPFFAASRSSLRYTSSRTHTRGKPSHRSEIVSI